MKTVNEHNLKLALLVGRVPPRPLTATFVVKATFALIPGGTAELLPEDKQLEFSGDAYEGDDPAQGMRYGSDFALFKPGTDLLLAGHCHALAGSLLKQAQVVFAVGEGAKRLVVFGDRFWMKGPLGSAMSEPQPFASMPLTWARAFGGPGDPHNPAGRGLGGTDVAEGTEAHLLPNIESIKSLVSSPHDRPRPVGFGPIDPASPLRASKTGTYNSQWLEQRWPWLPDDFDWTFFNAAPPDQQLERQFLKGDEALRFDNMHPRFPSYQCKLPGVRVRLFVKRRRGLELLFEEVPLQLDTLFADMDAETVALVWRGLSAADSMKLREFEEIFVVKEPLGSPLAPDLKSYLDLLEKRKAEIEEADLGEFQPPAPVVLTPPRVPDTSWADRLNEKVAALEKQIAEEHDSIFDAQLAGIMGAPRPTAPAPPAMAAPNSMAEADAIINAAITNHALKEPGTMQTFDNVRPQFGAIETEIDQRLAQMPTPIGDEPEHGERAGEGGWTRERVQAHAKIGGAFDGQDLSGLDLSSLDFSGCSFQEASLGEARLAGCTFDGCDLFGASLIQAIVTDASFRKSRLDSADLSEVTGPGPCFAEARLDAAEFTGGKLPGADFSGCQGRHASFDECDLSAATFAGCNLQQPDFSNATLHAATLKAAQMPDAAFYGASGGGADLEGAVMPRARFSGGDFGNCNFKRCQIEQGVFDEARLDNADFTEAALTGCAFTGAHLPQAVFRLARCEHAKFDDTIATAARFVQTNLFRATFENADLSKAVFWGSNCYEVEFFSSRIRDAVFEDTNLKRTKLA